MSSKNIRQQQYALLERLQAIASDTEILEAIMRSFSGREGLDMLNHVAEDYENIIDTTEEE